MKGSSKRVKEFFFFFPGKQSQERLRDRNPLTCNSGSIIHSSTLSSKQRWLHYKCRVLVLLSDVLGARYTARTRREASGARGESRAAPSTGGGIRGTAPPLQRGRGNLTRLSVYDLNRPRTFEPEREFTA